MVRSPEESIGKRIAAYRQGLGLTQRAVAERLAISRVAISHIESGLSLPSERTVTLLAGLFKCTPGELVGGTTYPAAKTERLPHVVACYTPLELDLALLANDLKWLDRVENRVLVEQVLARWTARLERWTAGYLAEPERRDIRRAKKQLRLRRGRAVVRIPTKNSRSPMRKTK